MLPRHPSRTQRRGVFAHIGPSDSLCPLGHRSGSPRVGDRSTGSTFFLPSCASRPRVAAHRGHIPAPRVAEIVEEHEGLPGCWITLPVHVPHSRTPPGCAASSPILVVADAVVFRLTHTLDSRDCLLTGLTTCGPHTRGPTHRRTSLLTASPGLAAGCRARLAGRGSNPLGDVFRISRSHRMYFILSDQPFLVATSHPAFCPPARGASC